MGVNAAGFDEVLREAAEEVATVFCLLRAQETKNWQETKNATRKVAFFWFLNSPICVGV